MFNVILEPISNREIWVDQVEVRDSSNTLVDLSLATIVLSVREPKGKRIILTATTDDATITILSLGIFQWAFTLAQTRNLCVETYELGCTIDIDSATGPVQFFVGTVSVVDGIVS
jgi:hypothetical protein